MNNRNTLTLKRMMFFIARLGTFLLLTLSFIGHASSLPTVSEMSFITGTKADVFYHRAGGVDLKLDIYGPGKNVWLSGEKPALPTVIYFHGGDWMKGSKAHAPMQLMPYVQQGWMVVSVQYRLGGDALAPAAVEDARCAVWWVKRHAQAYGFDPDRIVLSGSSAGGHLALITGMLPASAGYDRSCPERDDKLFGPTTTRELEVAAIVNWAGVTDIEDLIVGDNISAYAVAWLGAQPERRELARKISPIHYVRKTLPPIITLHGDKDQIAPYSHAVRLHKALDQAGVDNQLHTITGREHFVDFTAEDSALAYQAMFQFLDNYLIQ